MPVKTGLMVLSTFSEISKKLVKSGVKPELLSNIELSKFRIGGDLRLSFLIEYGAKGDSILNNFIKKSIIKRDTIIKIKPVNYFSNIHFWVLWNHDGYDSELLNSSFGKERVKMFSLVKDSKYIYMPIFSVPITTSNDDVAKIVLDYNKSDSDSKIDFFMLVKNSDPDTNLFGRKVIFLCYFTKEGGYSKSKLPDFIDNNDVDTWVLK
jgi:hypothetical protein